MSKPHKKELFLHQRDDGWYKVFVKEHTDGHPDNEVFRFIPECEVEELLKELINKRIDKLQKDLDYYMNAGDCDFTSKAHDYYKSIPTRILELTELLNNKI